MRNEHLPELTKISKVSTILLPLLKLAFYVSVFFLFLCPILIFSSPTANVADGSYFPASGTMNLSLGDLYAGALNIKDKLLFLVGISITLGLIALGIWFTRRLLLCFKEQDIFCSLSILYAKKVAAIYLAYVIFSTIMYFILILLNGHEEAVINPLAFSQDFIILGLLWMFVWILEIGTSLHTDSEMTI